MVMVSFALHRLITASPTASPCDDGSSGKYFSVTPDNPSNIASRATVFLLPEVEIWIATSNLFMWHALEHIAEKVNK